MAKTQNAESDEARLKKKIAAQRANQPTPQGNAALRSLRKRLKREQRKRRAWAEKRKHAGVSKPAETAQAAG
jgi:hypothetical protein